MSSDGSNPFNSVIFHAYLATRTTLLTNITERISWWLTFSAYYSAYLAYCRSWWIDVGMESTCNLSTWIAEAKEMRNQLKIVIHNEILS